MVNDWIDFTEMKALLNTTDGNLASPLFFFREIRLYRNQKEFVGKNKNLVPSTNMGRAALFP
jgi:hypothetical protein